MSPVQSVQICYLHLKINTAGLLFLTHPFYDQMVVLPGAPKAHTSQKHAIEFPAALNRR